MIFRHSNLSKGSSLLEQHRIHFFPLYTPLCTLPREADMPFSPTWQPPAPRVQYGCVLPSLAVSLLSGRHMGGSVMEIRPRDRPGPLREHDLMDYSLLIAVLPKPASPPHPGPSPRSFFNAAYGGIVVETSPAPLFSGGGAQ